MPDRAERRIIVRFRGASGIAGEKARRGICFFRMETARRGPAVCQIDLGKLASHSKCGYGFAPDMSLWLGAAGDAASSPFPDLEKDEQT